MRKGETEVEKQLNFQSHQPCTYYTYTLYYRKSQNDCTEIREIESSSSLCSHRGKTAAKYYTFSIWKMVLIQNF